ncbi:MAG: sel1 repeat family protein [Betaproteobacteria bacterium]|nr:sel1 repeat family protein [Betaproteobacteria bacterium]
MYANGRGVERDDAEAVKFYTLAAGQGVAIAQFNLGAMYQNGRGVERDDAEAVKWYRKSAEQGFSYAQNDLGVMYDGGQGVAQNDAEAVKWYRKAAEQGLAISQKNLGVMYATGRGVDLNYAESAKWFRMAAEQGDEDAYSALEKVSRLEQDQREGISHDGSCRPRTNVIRCSSQCYNGDCVVTYENGCRVRVQVRPRYDSFREGWTYPSPDC